ncbi:MAG TPA: AraC family transcriptional regulator, partial [Magnetovibrio sp.]
VAYVAEAINTYVPELQNDIIIKSLSDTLLTHVLKLVPNSYSALLEGRGKACVMPRYLKRARDYIHAHAASVITLESLSAHAGCGYRTLQAAFNDAFGMSPMTYVKHVRLSFARDDLLSAADGVTVRDIALKWGFMHVGWFSKNYAERFGCLPSETLRTRG